MQVRRCAHVVEPRERLDFDLSRLLAGESGLENVREWIALAAHADAETHIDEAQMRVLGALSPQDWQAFDALLAQHPREVLEALLANGLLISDSEAHAGMRARDDDVRASHWRGIGAVVQRHSRWTGIDTAEAERRFGREKTDRRSSNAWAPGTAGVRKRRERSAHRRSRQRRIGARSAYRGASRAAISIARA